MNAVVRFFLPLALFQIFLFTLLTAIIHCHFQCKKKSIKNILYKENLFLKSNETILFISIRLWIFVCMMSFLPVFYFLLCVIKIFKLWFTADLTNLVLHNEWDVVSMKAIRNVLYYQCCPDPYPDITFSLEIKRKPLFYIMSILFPCILTGSVAALGFALPPESGEKVSLEVTVLLSLAVFLLMVTEQLPASSVNFPYVGRFCSISQRDVKQVNKQNC